MKHNLLLLSDSYKYSHFKQYPKGTKKIFSYLEARGGDSKDIVFFGLQYFIKEYINNPFTQKDIQEAKQLAEFHGVPFNEEGWNYILNKHGGFLPVKIDAVPEGSVNKVGDVLMTIVNTDDNCPWVTNWVETLLMKVWYPTTVATKAYNVRKIIEKHYTNSSDSLAGVDFAYHNFGDRGSSSVEAAMLGGMAHLTSFSGTDNFNAVMGCSKYYAEKKGWSIPASEHSTVTSWGKDYEYFMIDSYLENHKGAPIIACVMDSYDIYKAVEHVTTGSMKERIESPEYPIFVIRPDSGNPIDVIGNILGVMRKNEVSYTVNSKGFKVFNKYRIIWGDGITPSNIDAILSFVEQQGYAADNMAFGSGGDLMQNLNRDTHKFAFKCSAALVGNEWRDVYKEPITDKGKSSKRGLLTSDKLQTVYEKYPVVTFTLSEVTNNIRGISNEKKEAVNG
jgi:nicotinamide phosphoribosyltransferase